MASEQRTTDLDPGWQASLYAPLAGRLVRPLLRPGVIAHDLGRQILTRIQRRHGPSPLFDQLSRRLEPFESQAADRQPIVVARALPFPKPDDPSPSAPESALPEKAQPASATLAGPLPSPTVPIVQARLLARAPDNQTLASQAGNPGMLPPTHVQDQPPQRFTEPASRHAPLAVSVPIQRSSPRVQAAPGARGQQAGTPTTAANLDMLPTVSADVTKIPSEQLPERTLPDHLAGREPSGLQAIEAASATGVPAIPSQVVRRLPRRTIGLTDRHHAESSDHSDLTPGTARQTTPAPDRAPSDPTPVQRAVLLPNLHLRRQTTPGMPTTSKVGPSDSAPASLPGRHLRRQIATPPAPTALAQHVPDVALTEHNMATTPQPSILRRVTTGSWSPTIDETIQTQAEDSTGPTAALSDVPARPVVHTTPAASAGMQERHPLMQKMARDQVQRSREPSGRTTGLSRPVVQARTPAWPLMRSQTLVVPQVAAGPAATPLGRTTEPSPVAQPQSRLAVAELVSRAPVAADSAGDPPSAFGQAVELPSRSMAGSQPEIDLERVTDQVYRRLVSRLRSESERRGR